MIVRTQDYREVRRCWLDEGEPPISLDAYYLLDGYDGLWALHPRADGLQIHANLGVEARSKGSVKSALRAFKWVWENTLYDKIYAMIPRDNRAACLVAITAGMIETENTNPDKRIFEVKKWADL